MVHKPLYEVVALARTPVQSSAATLLELGPIHFNSLSWEDTINRDPQISFSVKPETLQENIKTRLRDLLNHPMEIRVYRNGTVVAEGPVVSYTAQGDSIAVTGFGSLYLLRYMLINDDTGTLSYSDQDQTSVIGKGLVDAWQALDYGNYGIITNNIPVSGKIRDREYVAADAGNIHKLLFQLGAVNDGFDIWVDPANRNLMLSYTERGVDKSLAVIFDRRTVAESRVSTSIASGQIASDVFAVGVENELGTVLTSSSMDAAIRANFGRSGWTQTHDGVGVQTTLDDKATRARIKRGTQNFMPQPSMHPIDGGMPNENINAGDTVEYTFDYGLGYVTDKYRILTMRVGVDQQGNEDMSLEFE